MPPEYLEQRTYGKEDGIVEKPRKFSEWWRNGVLNLKESQIGYYDHDDIHEVLGRVYPGEVSVEAKAIK